MLVPRQAVGDLLVRLYERDLNTRIDPPDFDVSITNMKSPRPYKQASRAEAAAETAERIIAAFLSRARIDWMDEITLERVAADAGVTVQTVIRRFGGKEGLLAASAKRFGEGVVARRGEIAAGDWRRHVRAAADDYEVSGDFVLRLLAQEARWPALRPVLDNGRAGHREMVRAVYGPWLERAGPEAARLTAAVVAATDVYTWGLLRRDQGLDAQQTWIAMAELTGGLLGEPAAPDPVQIERRPQ